MEKEERGGGERKESRGERGGRRKEKREIGRGREGGGRGKKNSKRKGMVMEEGEKERKHGMHVKRSIPTYVCNCIYSCVLMWACKRILVRVM